MLIIIDAKLPAVAKEKLAEYGDLMELKTAGITYESISGHPDIFFCQTPKKLIVAPNIPNEYIKVLRSKNINYDFGYSRVGKRYPETALYNACVAGGYLIHNTKITDKYLLQEFNLENQIHVNQGYCRCNLLYLGKKKFICSDLGILNSLKSNGADVFYIDPRNVQLQDFAHGFFGGCTGIYEKKIFLNGCVDNINDTSNFVEFIGNDYEIIELHNGALIDVGSIFFLRNDATNSVN